MQLPLHEPYFDLTLIRATHTKIPNKRIYKTYLFFLLVTKKANLLRMPLSACDEWLVPIQGLFTVTWWFTITSNFLFMQPNFRLQFISILSYFVRLAKIHIFASLCLGICVTSIAHNIKAMMTCLCPLFLSKFPGLNALS